MGSRCPLSPRRSNKILQQTLEAYTRRSLRLVLLQAEASRKTIRRWGFRVLKLSMCANFLSKTLSLVLFFMIIGYSSQPWWYSDMPYCSASDVRLIVNTVLVDANIESIIEMSEISLSESITKSFVKQSFFIYKTFKEKHDPDCSSAFENYHNRFIFSRMCKASVT